MNIAICGLDCSVCPAYVVHQTGDAALREKTAEEWKKQYGAEITPEMVDCAGCTVLEGPHIGYCFECEIRKCGLEKNVANCALCALYPCALISPFIEKVPAAKANLEKIRAEAGALPPAKTGVAAKPRGEIKLKAKPKGKAKAKPKVKPKPKAKPKAAAKAKPPKVKPKAKAKPKAKPKIAPKTKPKVKTKAKAKPKTKKR